MLASVQRALIDAEDWKAAFLSLVSERLDEIEKEYPIDSITDITKSFFQNRSEIMGQAALALIEKKFGHLLDQHYCECPFCNRRIKAKPEKVRREIDTVVGPVTLYRPYFYCTTCAFGFYPLDDALGLSNRKAQLDIQELEAWLTAEMPYETTSEALARCAGIKLSNHHAHDVVNEIAADIQLLDICPIKRKFIVKLTNFLKTDFVALF